MARRGIRQYNLGRQLVREYSSIAELQRALNLDSNGVRHIRMCCDLEPNCDMVYGYIWRYKDKDEIAGVDFGAKEQWHEIRYVYGRGLHNYHISSYGRVAQAIHCKTGLLAPQGVDSEGNPFVKLKDFAGWFVEVPICLLVASEFVTNPNGSRKVRHKDGNPFNNRYDNLEWC